MRSLDNLGLRRFGVGLGPVLGRHLSVLLRLLLLAGDGENLVHFLAALRGVGKSLVA